jgi:hypothetical protein
MNVMAQAHKAAKEFFASVTETGLSYAKVLQIKLRVYHREYKAMNQAKPEQTVQLADIKTTLEKNTSATGFSIVGTVVDSENNVVHVGESSGSEARMQSDANYYMNSANGYSKQDLYLELYGVHGRTNSFKIVK